MFEKVNPSHPDKVADRIAGALVDEAYRRQRDPRIAVEVLIGHGDCHIIAETSIHIPEGKVREIVRRIAGQVRTHYKEVPQDPILAENQDGRLRCGDNGIFKGTPITAEQRTLSLIARLIYQQHPTDGKYILDQSKGLLVICQSNATKAELGFEAGLFGYKAKINPLGYWTGGTGVDTGATNRKLGSDMADSVTGGGLHGKDLSKADVSANIYAFLKAQATQSEVNLSCAIGDEEIDGVPYEEIVRIAGDFIKGLGGFERLAEWGLI